ncbi:uncharacterized protein LOC135608255 isoform X2 [Musa acuminata AAA Group]|uniref:uncharacterized protein LOC135608255 isoform X2 n=1 Tax=Musa acuminata AAA Group TaxID=214697 RepID=UPI0031E25A05
MNQPLCTHLKADEAGSDVSSSSPLRRTFVLGSRELSFGLLRLADPWRQDHPTLMCDLPCSKVEDLWKILRTTILGLWHHPAWGGDYIIARGGRRKEKEAEEEKKRRKRSTGSLPQKKRLQSVRQPWQVCG